MSKRMDEANKLVEAGKLYDAKEAIDLALKMPKAKFDETVEMHIKLGVDSKQADQQVRGVIVLPNGTGKSKKVLVLARGEKADQIYQQNLINQGIDEDTAKQARVTKGVIRAITDFDNTIQKNHSPRKQYLNGIYGGIPISSSIDYDEIITVLNKIISDPNFKI